LSNYHPAVLQSHGIVTPTSPTPWHLWLVGIAGGLWSSIGVLSFMLTLLGVLR